MIKAWDNYKLEGEKVVFTIPEPKQRYVKSLLDLGIEFETDEYREWKIANKHFERLNSVSKKMREDIYNKFKSGGITILEVANLFKVDSDLVSDIVLFNIEKRYAWREDSIWV